MTALASNLSVGGKSENLALIRVQMDFLPT